MSGVMSGVMSVCVFMVCNTVDNLEGAKAMCTSRNKGKVVHEAQDGKLEEHCFPATCWRRDDHGLIGLEELV
jgi:hypothetical protein